MVGKGICVNFAVKEKSLKENPTEGNQVMTLTLDKRDMASNFPFSQEECKQLLDMLNKNKDKISITNQVGNNSKHDEFSGKVISFT